MTLKRIEQIESLILNSDKLPEDTKADLLKDLAALKEQADTLAKGESDVIPREVGGIEGGPIQPVGRELSASVEGLEASHPQLTELVNRIAVVLSNMGI